MTPPTTPPIRLTLILPSAPAAEPAAEQAGAPAGAPAAVVLLGIQLLHRLRLYSQVKRTPDHAIPLVAPVVQETVLLGLRSIKPLLRFPVRARNSTTPAVALIRCGIGIWVRTTPLRILRMIFT